MEKMVSSEQTKKLFFSATTFISPAEVKQKKQILLDATLYIVGFCLKATF
jgi:hypothetical protein